MDSVEQTRPSLGALFKEARKRAGLTGARLAQQAGCTQSAISQFEGGKATALRRDTVERIADILGVELPEETQGGAAEAAAPVAPALSPAAFCPNCECPSNVPYLVGGAVALQPRRQPDPSAKYCPWCGEVLEHSCPQCETPATQTAFCPACGAARVAPPEGVGNLAEWVETRRREIAALDALV